MKFPNAKDVSKDQCKDAGMAFTLLALLGCLFLSKQWLLIAAVCLLLLTMTVPMLLRGPAALWFGFSHLLGTVVSTILLTVIFFLVVTPIGLVRRMLGYDSLRLRSWKKDEKSVFVERNHAYQASDLEHPF